MCSVAAKQKTSRNLRSGLAAGSFSVRVWVLIAFKSTRASRQPASPVREAAGKGEIGKFLCAHDS
jgi:hypothetical protein